jgi:hypothetical protein
MTEAENFKHDAECGPHFCVLRQSGQIVLTIQFQEKTNKRHLREISISQLDKVFKS